MSISTGKKALQKVVRSLRSIRKWHRYLGLSLAVLLLISAVTGLLLSWKKNVDILQPATTNGASTELNDWKPIDEIARAAVLALEERKGIKGTIDRIDARPSKGIAKVLFEKGNWEVQVDGSTGEILSIGKRHADWIEKLHDGSIISDGFKLVSMNYLGIGLFFLTLAGFWLWYGPKRIRSMKRRRKKKPVLKGKTGL